MENIETNAGALPSNAGDDFHLLWAAQKILYILKPNAELKAVTVEGPAWQDSVTVNIDESKLYSIDLAEYYGGETFQKASKVIFSQLKYSTYMSDVEWTVASLCHSDNKKKDNSIIRRLADTYKEFTDKYTEAKDKLIIKLVSNRSISDGFKKSISKAKELITNASNSYKWTKSLIKDLPEELRPDIQRIYEESNLNSMAFLGFIKILDFEDCGAATRSIQKAKIIQQLGNWGVDNLQNKYNEIIMTLRERMMPGRNAKVPMTKDFVCSLFGGIYTRLFPAPANIPTLKNGYIERECVHDLIKIVLKQDNAPICVHATAGIGKTTLVYNLNKYLPDGSVVVFYDCYGGGTYLQPIDSRYECDTAIPQICNSLALECKTNFLLERRLKESEFFQELCIRLKHAVRYLKSFSNNAIVLLIIDAADNCIYASKQNGKACFIDKLLQQPLPTGVRLLLTYRTEHEDYFSFPHNSAFFKVPAFNLYESTKHIKSLYPAVADEVCIEFDKLSYGIPRVQAYVLELKPEEPRELIDILRPNGKTTEDLLNYILEEIRQRYGEKNEEISLIFGVLINLPRPIPLVILTKIISCSLEMLQSLSVDCAFGLYIENDYIYFRDEDFETFLREKYCDNQKAVCTIVDFMFQNRRQDAYCAKHVHSLLARQNNISKLLNITLEESIDESLVDISEASRIMLSRIKTVLNFPILKTQEYWKESFQLIYKIIDFSKSDEAINKLIQANPEQAYLYCDKNTLLKVFTTDRNDFDDLGKAALIFSMDPETEIKAISYLESYKGAFNYYCSKPENKRNIVNRPHFNDIVNVAGSLLRLKGEISMKFWITRWTNKEFQAKILFKVLVRLINRDDLQLANQLEKIHWSFHCKLSIVTAYLLCKKAPPIYLVEHIINVFNKVQNINLANFNEDHMILFFEYLCKVGKDRNMLLSIISKYQINYCVTGLPYIHGDDEQKLDCNIRFYVLNKAIRNENFHSEDFIDKGGMNKDKRFTQKEIDERTNNIKKIYDFLLPAYMYRIQVILGEKNEVTDTLFKDCLATLFRLYWSDMDYQKTGYIRLYILALSDGVLYIPGLDSQTIYNRLLEISRTTKIYRETKFALAELCAFDQRSQQFTLETLKSISDELFQYPLSALEASEAYIHCAQIGQKVEKNVGRVYFEKALQAAKGLDYESYRKLELFHVLANIASKMEYLSDVELSHEFVRLAEDFYRKMGDSNNFPYQEVFETATTLCPMNIFSVMCRLDDRNDFDHFSLPESAFYVLSELLRKNIYQADIIASLSTILLPEQPSDYLDLAKIILEKLSKASAQVQQKGLDILIHDTLYNVPLTYKDTIANEITNFINKHRPTMCEESQEIIALHEFLCSINAQEEKKLENENKKIKLSCSDLDSYVKTYSEANTIQLSNWLKTLDRDSQLKFIDLWLSNTLSERHVSKANILLEICLKDMYSSECLEILDILIKYLNSWSLWPSIAAWRNDVSIQKAIFVEHTNKILNPNYDCYDKLTHIFNVQTDNIRAFLIEYLLSTENVSNEIIIEILKKLSMYLTADFAKEILNWCVSIEIPNVHSLSGDNPFSGTFLQVEENLKPICKLLWRVLGHPDKKLRWTAVHMIQNLYLCGHSSIIEYFIALYHAPFDLKYMDKNNFFFVESAKLYFLLVCIRIFREEPQNGVPFYNFFKEIACSKQIIHALQRRFAKHISLRIAEKSYPGDIAQLLNCDEMKCGKVKKTPRCARVNFSTRQKFRFDFDYMDTLPYWYDDVANIFSLTQEEVAKDCDYYIQQFDIDNNKTRIWHDEYLHNNRYRNRNTLNDHGKLPEIETLEKYAEWHAMFYVADQYRSTLPYSEDSYKGYHDWLDSYLPGYEGYWSCEYRDHIPFIPFLWEFKKYKNPENDCEYMIPLDFIHSLIVNGDNIISYLNYNSSFDQSSYSIKIKSALINEKDIDKLICELKNPHNIFEYYYYDPDPEERRYAKKNGFSIWPIDVNVATFRDDRLDRHDPFAKDVYTEIYSFSKDILAYCGYKRSDLALFSLPVKNKQFPFHITNWSEPSEEGGYLKQGTCGSIAQIETKLCLNFLTSIKKALIFNYSIVFEDETYHFSGTPSKAAKEKGVFVLYKNGNTESYVLKRN